MTLSFQPNRAVYDSGSGILRFFATEGAVLVRCGVSKDALVALSDGRPGDTVLERIYERHQQRIHQIAERKHRANQVGKDGAIVVSRGDLAI
jgi:Protein of unknown function (DUF1488)